MLESPWPDLTSEEVVAQFEDYLTPDERQEILDFELDGEDTLGAVCAALEDKGLDCDVVLERVGAHVVIRRPSQKGDLMAASLAEIKRKLQPYIDAEDFEDSCRGDGDPEEALAMAREYLADNGYDAEVVLQEVGLLGETLRPSE